MLYGVFSDVHGNFEALEACLERLRKEGVSHFIFCGDLIGYGPDPEACVQRVAALKNTISVMGNHDAVFLMPELESFFNREAAISLDYSRNEMSENSVRFVSKLPHSFQGENFTVVHGTPLDPIKEYFSSCMQFKVNYHLWKGKICFVGHTHLPFYIRGNEQECGVFLNRSDDFLVKLDDDMRYIINPGSVGKPRDNNPRASFGIWDTEKETFRFLRQEYDYHPTQRKMQAAKLPSFLVDSLSLGI